MGMKSGPRLKPRRGHPAVPGTAYEMRKEIACYRMAFDDLTKIVPGDAPGNRDPGLSVFDIERFARNVLKDPIKATFDDEPTEEEIEEYFNKGRC